MKDSTKSATKIMTKLITTALVVLSPTPLAPPAVVNPQAQLICEHQTRTRTMACCAALGDQGQPELEHIDNMSLSVTVITETYMEL